MNDREKIKEEILAALKNVIDPETGADVGRMRFVMDLAGKNRYHKRKQLRD